MGDGVSAPSVPSSIKPMERKKKRKQMDKERRRSVLENEESLPKQVNVESKGNDAWGPVASLSTTDLPEFHIELQEVQKAYDRLENENKDLVEAGLKLEALKVDGLDNCASSLRYAAVGSYVVFLHQESDASSELVICCKKAFAAPDDLDSFGEDELDSDAKPELMDVRRYVAFLAATHRPCEVFRYLSGDVTDDGLLLMLRIIKKDLKPARLEEAGSEDDEDDDDDLLGVEEEEDIDEAKTGETAESDEQSGDSEAAVGGEGADTELPEESDDSDEGMDENAMFRWDTYLVQIFKENKNQAGGETAQSQLVLFKFRVLSLLEIYLHENRGKCLLISVVFHKTSNATCKPLFLTVYSKLAQAFVNPQSKEGSEQLEQRKWGILQRRVLKEKKLPKDEFIQLPTLESLSERNIKLASKPFKGKNYASTLSNKRLSATSNRYKMIVSLSQNSRYWILKITEARNFSDAELKGIFYLLPSYG
ncbi:hypothetical protein DITRI_Ditri08aG0095900 [Diplodiscus trichospermus]